MAEGIRGHDEHWCLGGGASAEVEEVAAGVRRAALRVHRGLGPGYRESIYRWALAHALERDGFHVEQEVWLRVTFEGKTWERAGRADLIVNGSVLVETKAASEFHPTHKEQVVSYLKSSGLSLGLLFNFHAPVLLKERKGYDRFVHPRHLKFP